MTISALPACVAALAEQKKLYSLTAELISGSDFHMQCLYAADALKLEDWMIGAGFVRNLIWDHIHGYKSGTPLNDIDLVYHDPKRTDKQNDGSLESRLNKLHCGCVWEVKNQARMHRKTGHQPYQHCTEAISMWVETATCIGVRLHQGAVQVIAPLGLSDNWAGIVRCNPAFADHAVFLQRVAQKQWLNIWPQLVVYKE